MLKAIKILMNSMEKELFLNIFSRISLECPYAAALRRGLIKSNST